MAARDGSTAGAAADGRGSWGSRSFERPTDSAARETWLCRSTLDAESDVEDDLGSESNDGDEADCATTAPSANKNTSEQGVHDSEDRLLEQQPTQEKATKEMKPIHTRSRKLTLGSHLDVARSHALRKILPPLPLTPSGAAVLNLTPHAATEGKTKRKHEPLAVKRPVVSKGDDLDKIVMKKSKRDGERDSHLAIYMDYEREPGFGKSPKRRAVYVVRHAGGVYATLFLSTACVHCVSFNVSPALRRLFRIEALPVGLCVVLAWTILGLVNCLGAWVGRQGDRVMLLRRLAWVWILAVVLLQLAKILPVVSWLANTMVGIGYIGAATAHGLMIPTVIAVGAEAVAAKAAASYHQHDEDSVQRRQQSVDVAISTFITWGFGMILAASSLVQAFYFASVDLELGSGEDVLVLRTRRSVCITIPCGTLLLGLLVAFLFQSRHHYVPSDTDASATESSSSSGSSTPVGSSNAETRARNALERKLARGELEDFELRASASSATPKRLGVRHWFQLARRSVALLAMGFFALLLLVAVGTTLVAHATVDHSSHSSVLIHLVIFAVLSAGWILTMLLSASQLGPSPRDKLYGHIDDLMTVPFLPSRHQLFVLVALVCLGSAAALAAFVRAQLYSTLFVQTCQLRRPHDAPALYDPNVMGAWVGLASVLLLPAVHFALRLRRAKLAPPRVSAVRRVVIGVLLYLISIFLSSVVELYRRASRWPADLVVANPAAAGCNKAHPSNFTVLWSVPHLAVFSLADAVFRVGAAEEAYALTAPLDWLGVAQGVLSLADSVGYAAALALTRTLSPWLYHVKTSDLVLLLLLITAIASLSYALTKRLADHVHASRQPRPRASEYDSSSDSDDDLRLPDEDESPRTSNGDPAGRKEAQRIAQDERDRLEASLPSSSSSRLRLSARTLKIDRASR